MQYIMLNKDFKMICLSVVTCRSKILNKLHNYDIDSFKDRYGQYQSRNK